MLPRYISVEEVRRRFGGLKWAMLPFGGGGRNFQVDFGWKDYGRTSFRIDKKPAHIRVLKFISNKCTSFIYKLN